MNRPIKFIVWDIHNKEWASFHDYDGCLHCNRESFPTTKGAWVWAMTNDVNGDFFKFYQFTGLLDKDGKEIYEGHKLDHKFDQEVFWDEMLGMFQVKAGRKGYVSTPLWCMNERFKIIGHIAEETP